MNWRVEQPKPGKLPKPPHWTDPPPSRFRVVLLVCAILGVMAALSLATSAGRFGLAQVVLPVWAAVMLLASMTVARRRQSKATSTDYGTTLYVDRSASRVLMVGIGVLSALAILYSALVLAGLDMPPLVVSRRHRHSSHATDPTESALFTGIFGLALAISLPIVWKRYTGNFLNLSPDGFYAQEKPVKTGRWDDVLDILDFVPWADPALAPTPNAPLTPIVFVMRDRSLQMLPSGSGYAPNGRAVFWMVRNYWLHPEERAELLNGVALNRLAQEEFPYA